jgi:nucleotide-binding universal stress UspA family protein
MTHTRFAYMPLTSYPEAVDNKAIEAAVGFAASLECALKVTAFSVDIPRISSGLGDFLIDIPGLAKGAEERSKAETLRLQDLVKRVAKSELELHCASRQVPLGSVSERAVTEARYYDLTLLPWSADTDGVQDLAEAIVFGSGRPAVLIPPSTQPAASLNHVAIAWDASRVAARALGDALPLLAEGGRISVLTVQDEKPLGNHDIAAELAKFLKTRGFVAEPVGIQLGKMSISETLQETARSNGAQLLAMGGYGHSRLRDFILGGATKGVLTQLQLPVMLSH